MHFCDKNVIVISAIKVTVQVEFKDPMFLLSYIRCGPLQHPVLQRHQQNKVLFHKEAGAPVCYLHIVVVQSRLTYFINTSNLLGFHLLLSFSEVWLKTQMFYCNCVPIHSVCSSQVFISSSSM